MTQQQQQLYNQMIAAGIPAAAAQTAVMAAYPTVAAPAVPGPGVGTAIAPGISSTGGGPAMVMNQSGQMVDSTATVNAGNTINPLHTVTNASGTAAFASSQGALVTIAGEGATSQQLYFVNPSTQQLIPFSSMQSAINYFTNTLGEPVTAQEINNATTQIPSTALSAGGGLSGYEVVPSANGFDENGALTNPAPSAANLQANYGQPTDQNAETSALNALDGFTNLVTSGAAGSTTLTAAEVTTLMSSPTQVGFYINALAYGGYTLSDVYQDMVRQQYIANGNPTAVENAYPISMSQTASVYKASTQYQAVTNNPVLNVSPTIAGLTPAMVNTPVLELPAAAFSTIAPLSDPNSPAFQQAMQQYQSATYQVALEMSTASNAAEHAQAQSDMASLQTEIQDRLGITLSDNAVMAWNQLNNFAAQAGMNNLGGSGLVQQQIDTYLKQQMSVNQSMRSYYQTYSDQANESYYQNYASPAEVQALIASNPQEAQAWGLAPSPAIQQYMTLSNLQTLFPNEPVANLQAIINEYMDPNGNFYSKLYSSYAAQNYATTGQQQAAEASSVEDASTNAATTALAQYSDPNNPFLKPGASTLPTQTLPSSSTETPPTSQAASAAINMPQVSSAAANLGATASANTGSASTNPTTEPSSSTVKPPATTPTVNTPNGGGSGTGANSSSNPYGFTGAQLTAYNYATSLIPKAGTSGSSTLGLPSSINNPATPSSSLSIGSSGQLNTPATTPAPLFNTSSGTFYTPPANTPTPATQTSSPLLTGTPGGGSWLSSLGSAVGNFFKGL